MNKHFGVARFCTLLCASLRAAESERAALVDTAPAVLARIARVVCSVIGITSIVACGWSEFTRVAVPELDRRQPFVTSVVAPGESFGVPIDSSATLLRLNGEPTFKRQVGSRETWVYATRSFSPKGRVPAALLRIEFDAADVVSDWYFLDPHSNQQLPIRETVAQAAQTFGHPRVFCAATPIPVVDLESGLRRHVATRTTVGELMGRAELENLRVRSGRSGVIWEFYVDRPSAAFVPATLWFYEIAPNGALLFAGTSDPLLGCE